MRHAVVEVHTLIPVTISIAERHHITAMPTAAHRLTIMKPGCYVAMGGERVCFDANTLARIAAAYTPALREAPLVIGHPANDGTSPAHGWVTHLSMGPDGELVADLSHLSDEIKVLARSGKYRHLSASFMPPSHPANPRPDGWYLRHVGALGASGPAVPGLSTLAFAEACPICELATGYQSTPVETLDSRLDFWRKYWADQPPELRAWRDSHLENATDEEKRDPAFWIMLGLRPYR